MSYAEEFDVLSYISIFAYLYIEFDEAVKVIGVFELRQKAFWRFDMKE